MLLLDPFLFFDISFIFSCFSSLPTKIREKEQIFLPLNATTWLFLSRLFSSICYSFLLLYSLLIFSFLSTTFRFFILPNATTNIFLSTYCSAFLFLCFYLVVSSLFCYYLFISYFFAATCSCPLFNCT